MLHNMINLVVIMRRLAALTVSCLGALVADGRPTQTACGAIDPNGRPAVANGRPTQTPCGAIDPNGRPTAATRPTHSRPTREATGWPLGASLPHNADLSPTNSRATIPMAKCAQRSAH